MSKLVSIIIPCYNVANYLDECITSVYAQTHQSIEVICVDNNSSDSTKKVLEDLKKRYSNLIILEEEKIGAPAARNKGLEVANGDWIQFLDADDLLLPNKISQQIRLLELESKDFPFIASAYFNQNIKGENSVSLPETNPWMGLFSTNLGITSANLFNAQILRTVGGWTHEIKSSQEYDLMFKLMKAFGNPLIDTESNTIVRERMTGQISQRNPKEKWKQYIDLRLEIKSYLVQNHSDEWHENQTYYLNKLFSKLRAYANEDLETSVKIFKTHFPQTFKPEQSVYNTKSYMFFYDFLGFENTQKLKKLFNF